MKTALNNKRLLVAFVASFWSILAFGMAPLGIKDIPLDMQKAIMPYLFETKEFKSFIKEIAGDSKNSKPINSIILEDKEKLVSMSFTQDSNSLITVISHMPDEGVIKAIKVVINDVFSGKKQSFICSHEQHKIDYYDSHYKFAPIISPKGTMIATFGAKNDLKIWDINSGKESLTIEVSSPFRAQFSPDEKFIIIDKREAGGILIYNLVTNKSYETTSNLKHFERSPISIDPNSKYFIFASEDSKKITKCDIETGNKLWSIDSKKTDFLNLSISPDSKFFVVSNPDAESVNTYKTSDGGLIHSSQFKKYNKNAITIISPDNKFIVVFYEKILTFIDAATGKTLDMKEIKSRATAYYKDPVDIGFLPNSLFFHFNKDYDRRGIIKLFNLSDQSFLGSIHFDNPVKKFAASPNSKYLATKQSIGHQKTILAINPLTSDASEKLEDILALQPLNSDTSEKEKKYPLLRAYFMIRLFEAYKKKQLLNIAIEQGDDKILYTTYFKCFDPQLRKLFKPYINLKKDVYLPYESIKNLPNNRVLMWLSVDESSDQQVLVSIDKSILEWRFASKLSLMNGLFSIKYVSPATPEAKLPAGLFYWKSNSSSGTFADMNPKETAKPNEFKEENVGNLKLRYQVSQKPGIGPVYQWKGTDYAYINTQTGTKYDPTNKKQHPF